MALLNYHFINWLLEFDRILVLSNTYRAKVPSYDENRDISLHFNSELHCMIQQLFQRTDFSSIGLVVLTELTCTRDSTIHFDHSQRPKDNPGRNYDHKNQLFEPET